MNVSLALVPCWYVLRMIVKRAYNGDYARRKYFKGWEGLNSTEKFQSKIQSSLIQVSKTMTNN